MNVRLQDPKDRVELQRRIRKETDAKQRDRHRAVLLAIDGRTAPEIVRQLGRSRRFVQRWVYAYRDGGLDAIEERPRSGRPAWLSPDQQAELLGLIAEGVEGQSRCRGVDAQRILAEHFGKTYSLSGVFRLLHALGYEPLRPRPVNPKKDPCAEKQWLEQAPLLSGECETNALTNASKSGSRMRAGSDKRGR